MILELTKVFEGEGYIKTYILTLDVNFFMLNPLLPLSNLTTSHYFSDPV